MKKITSLIMAVLMLCTMLTVFALPVSAEGKEKVKVPSEVHLHYTGEELTAFEDTDKYTVIDGKRTGPGSSYYAILTLRNPDKYEWESTNSSNSSEVRVSFEIHKYRDSGNGYCRECGEKGNMLSVDYLERKINDDNSVSTEEKICKSAYVITKEDTEWGVSGKSTWYVVNNASDNVELKNRPVVKGDVHIILKNFATLTANKGITVEGENSISFYAQSDRESEMGKLSIAATEENGSAGVTAIGSRNGGNGETGLSEKGHNINGGNGENGIDCGKIYFYGGNFLLKSKNAACIGGGNGGKGGNGGSSVKDGYNDACEHGGRGGNGGKGGTINGIYFYAGNISLVSTGTGACISGGNGGNGGGGGKGRAAIDCNFCGNGGGGGKGGTVNDICFYGGNISLKSAGACIISGNGGNGGNGFKNIPDLAYQVQVRLVPGSDGDGGNSGNINVYFYGGNTQIESAETTCFLCGGAGTGGNGTAADPGIIDINVSGAPLIKAGSSEQDAGAIDSIEKYIDQMYLSVQYNITSSIGSVLSDGNLWIIIAVAVIALGGVAAIVIVRKKKKTA